MDFVFVTGKLGQGKTLISMSKIRDRIRKGCKVATNCDIRLENMFNRKTDKPRVIRLPDKPTLEDLEFIGKGHDGPYDETKNGLLVLDECGDWFNARNWQDKSRAGVNSWFRHARKLGWDVYLIVQNISIIDNQARDSLAAAVATCRRLDKLQIPFITPLSKLLLDYPIRPPKLHIARVEDDVGFILDRWTYTGTDLYSSYDTRQVFRSDYPHGVHSLLTPWHLYGRHSKPLTFGRFMRLTRIYMKRFSKPGLAFMSSTAGALLAWSYLGLTAPESPHKTVSAPVAASASVSSSAPSSVPVTFAQEYGSWLYDGATNINGRLTFYLINPQGIRIASSDEIFSGVTFSEASSCGLKLKRSSDIIFIKCAPVEPPDPSLRAYPSSPDTVAQAQ